MASLTIPEARTRAANLATRFTTELPGIATFSPSSMTPDERARRIDALARIIRAADELLDTLSSPGSAWTEDPADARAIVAGLRHAALLLMAAYNPAQAWFWTPQWQAGEREVDAHRAAESARVYHTDEEFLAALDADL